MGMSKPPRTRIQVFSLRIIPQLTWDATERSVLMCACTHSCGFYLKCRKSLFYTKNCFGYGNGSIWREITINKCGTCLFSILFSGDNRLLQVASMPGFLTSWILPSTFAEIFKQIWDNWNSMCLCTNDWTKMFLCLHIILFPLKPFEERLPELFSFS